MRKILPSLACFVLLLTCIFISCKNPDYRSQSALVQLQDDENELYDGPAERNSLEFEKTKDPALGYVPTTRLGYAIDYSENLKDQGKNYRLTASLPWIERGPNYDSVGSSNGNGRGGGGGVTGGYTSGRITTILIDTLNDPTGNTVFAGGIAGGLWKCTNFLSSIPNWQFINDRFNNLAISSICQDPSNSGIMYFSTGEATSNADAVFGLGVWKSTDKGSTWNLLPSTANFIRNFKIICDAAGNVYLAARTTTTPVEQPYGLLRSKDKGATWQNITPAGLTSSNAICTDIEISSTGKLHAAFGYTGTIVNHRYTTTAATVTSASGWNLSTGIRLSTVGAYRLELATLGDIVYGVTVNTGSNADSCYKSIDGGATWTKQNTTGYTGNLTNTQGWYNLTLSINPLNSNEFMVGGLDAYRSTNSGQTITIVTNWVSTLPYVHADHHFMQWSYFGTESRIIIGSDGGIFISRDAGVTWSDKNRNLGIKQFYDAAIHPDAGSNYLIAGAQDNGVHQLKNAGLSYSTEVTGGDGCLVHINRKNPQIQFGSYVYNQYRRSANGGQTWTRLDLSTAAQGMFVNPWDYDDQQNILYACWAAGQIVRVPDANTAVAANRVVVPVTGMTGTPSAFKVSPNTANRLFVGASNGGLFRVDNANAVPVVTNITGPSFAGFLNCISVGSSDNFLVAVFTNYGVNNIWYSNDGGTSWSAIDGDLPDMPVRWAIFHPQFNTRLIIATEAGVYSTDAANGNKTIWMPDANFPTVRTDALELRTSDNTVVAATHGRGLFTAMIPTIIIPEINFVNTSTTVTEKTTASTSCRGYTDYSVDMSILLPPTNGAIIKINLQAGGTATKGLDFDFTTNGDFINPSDQLIFNNGVTGTKQIQIRVYDDADVESSESFTLDYAISGNSNTAKGYNTTHLFTLIDNDNIPSLSLTPSFTLGTNNTDIITTSPFASNRIKQRVQYLFTANEIRAARILNASVINSMSLKVTTKNSTRPFTGFTISIGNTTNAFTNFTSSPLTQVYSADYSTVAGNNTFNFSTPFSWDGSSNIIVQFCFDNAAATGAIDQYPDFLEGNTYPLGATVRASVYANYTTGTTSGCVLPAAFISDQRANAIFGGSFGNINAIATSLNTAKTEYLNSNNDLYYYSPAGEIIAKVKSTSAQNYGCTQVVVDRAGIGTSQFWNFTPANYLMNKTFRILPTNNNISGTSEVTFYYTKEEKEGWEAATGQSWNNIMLVKVPSRISNVNPLNSQPDGPGTVTIVTPVRGTFGTGYTLTGTFANGFSGYGAGIPGRINTILTLSGQVDINGKDINLSWTTSAEIVSTQFEVEKSYDGVNFFKIGTVAASGTKLSPGNYSFVDHEFVQINYYRVKLLHSDGVVIVSNTIFVKNDNVPQRLIVLTNPFSNNITVRLSRVSTSPLEFSVHDMQGRLIKKYVAAPGSLIVTIDANSIISKGVYQLRVYIDNYVFYRTLLKQ